MDAIKDNAELSERIKEFLGRITGYMAVTCDIAFTPVPETSGVHVAIQVAEDANLLIGKNGQNLQALEHILRAMVVRSGMPFQSVSLDVNDYRKARTAELIEAVRLTANRVRETRKSEALAPMTSYERRLVHTELAGYGDLGTESVGQEPLRRVVIKPL